VRRSRSLTFGPLLPSCDHLLAPPLCDEIAPKRGQIFSHRSMALLYTHPEADGNPCCTTADEAAGASAS
jgi:hypothetical protein